MGNLKNAPILWLEEELECRICGGGTFLHGYKKQFKDFQKDRKAWHEKDKNEQYPDELRYFIPESRQKNMYTLYTAYWWVCETCLIGEVGGLSTAFLNIIEGNKGKKGLNEAIDDFLKNIKVNILIEFCYRNERKTNENKKSNDTQRKWRGKNFK